MLSVDNEITITFTITITITISIALAVVEKLNAARYAYTHICMLHCRTMENIQRG